MPRYSPYGATVSFGPGMTPAVKVIIIANVAAFVLQFIVPAITALFGLSPAAVFGQFAIWQLVTYMFLHGGPTHILFNMLSVWMFGVELERLWGTRFFVRYYLLVGIGAAATTIILSLTPLQMFASIYYSTTIGASGAIYGILLVYASDYPDRPILFFMVFPVPARYFVMIMGGFSLMAAMSDSGGGVAHVTHLGGLVVGYLLIKGRRMHPLAMLKTLYIKWRFNKMRRKFDVYTGGRGNDWNRRVH